MKNSPLYKFLLVAAMLCFTISASAQNTYYWFGGAGNWSQVSHWSLTSGNSGGVIAPAVPTSNDHVIFDDNSGFGTSTATNTVTISLEAFSKNFIVATTATGNSPRFAGAATLNVFGSISFSNNTSWVKTGDVFLKSVGAATITPNGVTTISSNWIVSSGSYTLLGPWIAASFLYVNAGATLSTNGHTLNVINFVHNGHVNLGASIVNCSGSWNSSAGATVNAGTSTINVKSTSYIILSSIGFASTAGLTWYNVNVESPSATNFSGGSGCTFNDVSFLLKGKFTIIGNNNFRNLTLSPGAIHEFTGGSNQVLSGVLTSTTPDCEGLTEIRTTTFPSARATLTVPGITNVINARITNMAASGGTINVVGVDNGGNLGFTFTSPIPKTLYWVGGSGGDWNNTANWSNLSGGPGGYCIPTQFDNVIFDSNSNASVPVNIGASAQGYCHNITVTGWAGAVLSITGGASSSLNIFGASTWKNGMNYSVPTTRYLSSDPSEPLVFDGVLQRTNTYFSGSGGWIFQDNFDTGTGAVDYGMWLEKGTLNTNSKNIFLQGVFRSAESFVNENSPRTLILGSSEFSVVNWITNINGGTTANYSLDPGTSHIIVRGDSGGGGNFNTVTGQNFYNLTFKSISASFVGYDLIFNKVVAENNLTIIGQKNYQILQLASSKITRISHMQTIAQQLVAGSFDCAPMAEIIDNGNNGTISMPPSATPVVIHNVRMQGIDAIGGNTFNATGVDLGGNNGWTFAGVASKTLYWIGGSGQWNDPLHWSTNADGSPSGGCVPNQYDDVIFNQFSGPGTSAIAITVNTNPAYFKNMIWTAGAPIGATITSDQNIFCYGSMTMGQNMSWISTSNTIYFKSSVAAQSILFNGSSSRLGLDFDNPTGGWIFQDYVKLVNLAGIQFRSGSLSFNGNNAELGSFFSYDVPSRNLNISNSQINITTSFTYKGSLGILNAIGSTISVGTTFTSESTILQWHDIIMRAGAVGNFVGGGANYNRVWLRKSTTVSGNNHMKILEIDQNQVTTTLTAGSTQTVDNMLYLSGTPCQFNRIYSSIVGTSANLNVLAGNDKFDFVYVRNINASGVTLSFERNSVNEGGNNNISFLTSGSTGLIGLGNDLECNEFDAAIPTTYTLNAQGFYGGPSTTYSWTKIGDPAHSGVLGTDSTLDISTLGFGTYRVDVNYQGSTSCIVNDQITVTQRTVVPITANNQSVCIGSQATVAKLTASGSNIKWYDVPANGTALALNTLLINGATYYASQTVNGCESRRVAVVVILNSCFVPVNPSMRSRVNATVATN
ncbi:beta strand repeat-containing protein [Pedobacter sandarakinus]|uniref:beta strand repeat-containing protein n=1 Tax=Pedobacter sandarakinus TaxID=353156 RepID=UPI002245197F|nr:hypothetical protein [Pedobacter sandarakinus]MCX2575631.1 hypothetical protein [Pedobacter sandarakinus]